MVLVDRSGALDSTCMVHGMPVAQEIKKIKRNCDEDDVEERVKAMKSQNPRKQNRVRSCVIGESQQFSPKNRNSTPFRVSPLPLSSFTSHLSLSSFLVPRVGESVHSSCLALESILSPQSIHCHPTHPIHPLAIPIKAIAPLCALGCRSPPIAGIAP